MDENQPGTHHVWAKLFYYWASQLNYYGNCHFPEQHVLHFRSERHGRLIVI